MTEALDALTDFDLHLFGEGNHHRIIANSRASRSARRHSGTRFAIWAPNAERVSVVGTFNGWNDNAHILKIRGESGVWEIFVPHIELARCTNLQCARAVGTPF